MKMTDVKDLPKSFCKVLVLLDTNEYAVATYDKDWGFEADDSGYTLDMDDDSGLNISLDGKVISYKVLD